MLGAAGIGGAAISGTGAFTSSSADREFSVEVVNDSNAYLGLGGTGNPNDAYIDDSNGEFEINLTGNNSTGAGGQGINPDGITVFEDVFEIRNQGTQEIDVEVTPLLYLDVDGSNALVIFVVPTTSFPGVTLGVGAAEAYSLVAVAITPDSSFSLNISETISITAEAT